MTQSTNAGIARTSSKEGQAVYSKTVLKLYDFWVGGVSCSFVWCCPSKRLLAHYNQHVGSVHLDVGVGTGYYLSQARFPTAHPVVTLFDLNENSLAAAAARIRRIQPTTILGDVLEPNALSRSHYDSIALSLVFHCLPDGGAGKWRALDHLAPCLKESGTLFGSTIVGPMPLARQRWLAGLYNRRGIFSNADDTSEQLELELRSRFRWVEVQQVGTVALFAARGALSSSVAQERDEAPALPPGSQAVQ